MKELEKIEPFMWLSPKKSDSKAKITGIIPAGSDIAYPYYRYKIEFETGDQIVLKDTVLKMLFEDLEILGTYKESFDETIERLENANKTPEDDKQPIIDEEKKELIEKAKKLGIKSAHLMNTDKLKAKIEQVELTE